MPSNQYLYLGDFWQCKAYCSIAKSSPFLGFSQNSKQRTTEKSVFVMGSHLGSPRFLLTTISTFCQDLSAPSPMDYPQLEMSSRGDISFYGRETGGTCYYSGHTGVRVGTQLECSALTPNSILKDHS